MDEDGDDGIDGEDGDDDDDDDGEDGENEVEVESEDSSGGFSGKVETTTALEFGLTPREFDAIRHTTVRPTRNMLRIPHRLGQADEVRTAMDSTLPINSMPA